MISYKFWSLGGGILLSLCLLTGCAKQPEQNTLDLHIPSKAPLYVQNFKSITNKPVSKGFNLGTYKSFGYTTKSEGVKSILFGPSSQDPYLSYKCTESPLYVTTMNVLMAPFVVGINLLMGGLCDQDLVFDNEQFNEDAKKWIEANGIEREIILKRYETLLNSQRTSEATINTIIDTKNQELHAVYAQYAATYSEKVPQILKKYNDNTGLYANEPLSYNVLLEYNTLNQHDSFRHKNYFNFINSAFSCTSTQSCLNNMEVAETELKNQYEKDKTKLPIELSSLISNYAKTLDEKTATINLSIPKKEHQETFGKKTIYYTIQAPEQIQSKQQQVNTLYTINRIDFKDVYPTYANKNEELAIVFDPKTRKLKLQNNTKQFLQLNSISLYYGDNIYQLIDNQSANFARELAPESFNTHTIPNIANESAYIKMTKAKVKTQKINFGFAIKYTIGDNTKNHTLYKQNTYAVHDLLKNI